ncbi:MAG: hypothetical protein H0X37_14330 [Herpetosiphonaceae bacterium]|nr:hypothetical protein [Herpetosiphonaceae bacterium]
MRGNTYPLILVSDPDALLSDPQNVAALHERTFRVITEPDPIALRYQVEQARPWSTAAPLIIVTPEPVNMLPYDLWQQGHHVELALHELLSGL